MFQNLQPYEIDKIGSFRESKGGNATEDLIRCVTHVAEKVGCKSSGKYCAILEYSYEYINKDRAATAAENRTRPRISDVVNELLASIGNPQSGVPHVSHWSTAKYSSSESRSPNIPSGQSAASLANNHIGRHKRIRRGQKTGPKQVVTPSL